MKRKRRLVTRAGIAIVGVIAAVALPRLFQTTGGGNETAAIATLRNIYSAQQQLRDHGLADADGDGRGEYGLSGELAGECFVRGTRKTLDPPVLSAAFCVSVDENGAIRRSGYRFRIFLPGKDGAQVTERAQPKRSVVASPTTATDGPNGCPCCVTRRVAQAEVAVDGPIDTDAAEERWYCYAWPMDAGRTGTRSFYIDQSGVLLAPEDPRESPPHAQPSRDGRRWTMMP